MGRSGEEEEVGRRGAVNDSRSLQLTELNRQKPRDGSVIGEGGGGEVGRMGSGEWGGGGQTVAAAAIDTAV